MPLQRFPKEALVHGAAVDGFEEEFSTRVERPDSFAPAFFDDPFHGKSAMPPTSEHLREKLYVFLLVIFGEAGLESPLHLCPNGALHHMDGVAAASGHVEVGILRFPKLGPT